MKPNICHDVNEATILQCAGLYQCFCSVLFLSSVHSAGHPISYVFPSTLPRSVFSAFFAFFTMWSPYIFATTLSALFLLSSANPTTRAAVEDKPTPGGYSPEGKPSPIKPSPIEAPKCANSERHSHLESPAKDTHPLAKCCTVPAVVLTDSSQYPFSVRCVDCEFLPVLGLMKRPLHSVRVRSF